jgi:hypothetical protein
VITPSAWQSSHRTALAVLAAACIVGLSGCGNWIPDVTDSGQMGLTVDAAGQPVIAVMTCLKTTVAVDMFEGRKKSDPEDKVSVDRGHWVARRAFAGVQKLSIVAPDDGWKTKLGPGQLEPDIHFYLEGRTTEIEYSSLGGTGFRIRDLAKLSPDKVEVNGKPMSWSAFAAYKCQKN